MRHSTFAIKETIDARITDDEQCMTVKCKTEDLEDIVIDVPLSQLPGLIARSLQSLNQAARAGGVDIGIRARIDVTWWNLQPGNGNTDSSLYLNFANSGSLAFDLAAPAATTLFQVLKAQLFDSPVENQSRSTSKRGFGE